MGDGLWHCYTNIILSPEEWEHLRWPLMASVHLKEATCSKSPRLETMESESWAPGEQLDVVGETE